MRDESVVDGESYEKTLRGIELQKLRWELEKRMSLDDSLMVICLCQGCASKVVTRGELQCEAWDSEPERWKIIG